MNTKINSKIKKLQSFNLWINIMAIIGFAVAIFLKKYYIAAPFPFLFIIKHFIIWDFFRKNLQFTTYCIKDNILYKVGLYPRGIKKQGDNIFRMDNFSIIEAIKKWYGFLEFGVFREDSSGSSHSYSSYGYLLDVMEKLTNQEYINKMLGAEIKNQPFEIYKITQIYSYNYDEETKRFNLICDSIDLSTNLNYDKTDIVLNVFDNYTELENYLKDKSLNTEIKEEEKYENSVIYKERKKSLLNTTIISVLMIIIAFILVVLFSKIYN